MCSFFILTRVHDVVTANGAVINVDVYYERAFQSNEDLPQAQRATAFHFFTSKRLATAVSILMIKVNLFEINY